MSSLPPDPPLDSFEERFAFEPTEEVAEFLVVLRESNLVWIAEEIEVNILEGKAASKRVIEPGSPARKGKFELATIPYTEAEQLCILLRTIRNYLVEPPKLWSNIQAELPRLIKQVDLRIMIMPPESHAQLELFSQYDEQSNLNELLREAWPYGPDAYDSDHPEAIE